MAQKKAIEVKLALLDEILDLNREAGSERVIQKPISDAFKKLNGSIELNKKALQKAEQGLKAAQSLGEQKAIETFKRWIQTINGDIKLAEKQLNAVKSIDIGF